MGQTIPLKMYDFARSVVHSNILANSMIPTIIGCRTTSQHSSIPWFSDWWFSWYAGGECNNQPLTGAAKAMDRR